MEIVITKERNEWTEREDINAFGNVDDLKSYLNGLVNEAEKEYKRDLRENNVTASGYMFADPKEVAKLFQKARDEINAIKWEDCGDNSVQEIPYGDDVFFYNREV